MVAGVVARLPRSRPATVVADPVALWLKVTMLPRRGGTAPFKPRVMAPAQPAGWTEPIGQVAVLKTLSPSNGVPPRFDRPTWQHSPVDASKVDHSEYPW